VEANAIKLRKKTPSPAGEGQGEEIKIKCLPPPLILTFSLKGEGIKSLKEMRSGNYYVLWQVDLTVHPACSYVDVSKYPSIGQS
jgi:hypothetical protein